MVLAKYEPFQMKIYILLFSLMVVLVCAVTSHAQDCTRFRNEVKTLSDSTAGEVDFKHIHQVSSLDLFNLDHVTYQNGFDYTRRIPGIEWAVFRVTAELVDIAATPEGGGDGDYDLRLSTPTHIHHPLVIEFPPEQCMKNSRYKHIMMGALQQLHRECNPVSSCKGKIVEVTGVGFWDVSKEKDGDGEYSHIELHPVLSFKIVTPVLPREVKK